MFPVLLSCFVFEGDPGRDALREQRRVCSMAVAAARQRGVDLAVAKPSDIADIAELPLERRRSSG